MNLKSNESVEQFRVLGAPKPENPDVKESLAVKLDLELEKLDVTFIKNTHFFQEKFEKLDKGSNASYPNYNSIEEALNSLCELDIAAERNQVECDEISETKNMYIRKVDDFSVNLKNLNDKKQNAINLAEETEKKLELLKMQLGSKEIRSRTSLQMIQGDLMKIQDVLGLQIVTSTQGGIVLSFTNIEKKNTSRKFRCHLGFIKKKYVAIDSDPNLPQLDKLVDVLNQINDLSGGQLGLDHFPTFTVLFLLKASLKVGENNKQMLRDGDAIGILEEDFCLYVFISEQGPRKTFAASLCDKYHMGSEVGSGATSFVYEAWRRQDYIKVVVKVINKLKWPTKYSAPKNSQIWITLE